MDYQAVGAVCNIDVEGQTLIRLTAYGQMYGDYYSGNGHVDRLMVGVFTGAFNPTSGLPVFKTVVGYEDNPTRSEFSDSLGMGTEEYAVEYGQIQVLRDEETNTFMVHWNIPLVCPETSNTPAVTLPPGKLVIQGAGSLKSIPAGYSGSIGTEGWTYGLSGNYYSGTAKLFCVDWDCKWTSVGDSYAGTSQEPRGQLNWVWTWTSPP